MDAASAVRQQSTAAVMVRNIRYGRSKCSATTINSGGDGEEYTIWTQQVQCDNNQQRGDYGGDGEKYAILYGWSKCSATKINSWVTGKQGTQTNTEPSTVFYGKLNLKRFNASLVQRTHQRDCWHSSPIAPGCAAARTSLEYCLSSYAMK